MAQPRMVLLSEEQIRAIESLVNMRQTELILADENPSIIDLYTSIKMQLKGR